MTELKIFRTPQNVAGEFAVFFQHLADEYSRKKQLLNVALSGGSTPKYWFEILAKEYKHTIHWELVHFYWGDERMVPSEDVESNFGEAKRILFDNISIPQENIHQVIGSNPIEDEIERYSNLIKNNLEQENGAPVFDLTILGMGDDGHTASIFPHQMDLLSSGNICGFANHPDSGQVRLTLTGTVINKARNVVFLVTGTGKAPKLRSIFTQEEGSEKFPAAHINPESGHLYFFVDSEAAAEIV
jgi:6-phosphogluconolactonase